MRPGFDVALSLLINIHAKCLPGMALFLLLTANNSLVDMEVEVNTVPISFVKSYCFKQTHDINNCYLDMRVELTEGMILEEIHSMTFDQKEPSLLLLCPRALSPAHHLCELWLAMREENRGPRNGWRTIQTGIMTCCLTRFWLVVQ